ncbi:hypothetical protein FBU30_005133 [Linnemannia zychae]|nr:hypothetical protein FBU30_005133 [Linnemannia zychae]
MASSFYAIEPKLLDGTPLNPLNLNRATPSPIVTWRLVLPSPSVDTLISNNQFVVSLTSHEVTRSLDVLYPQLTTLVSTGPTYERLKTCLAKEDTFTLLLATEISVTSAVSLPHITPHPPPTIEISNIIGTLTLVTLKLLMKNCAHVEDLVVNNIYRGNGIGKGLISRALDEAVNVHGCIMVDLTSNPARTEARALYQSLGFVLRDTGVFRYVIPEYRK